jgi:hypothetical protein
MPKASPINVTYEDSAWGTSPNWVIEAKKPDGRSRDLHRACFSGRF